MKLICLLVIFALTSSAATRKPPGNVQPPTEFDPAAIDTYVAGQVKEKGIAGLSVVMMREGKVELAKAYGSRSLETKEPATTNTLFAIGSVTKQFTCACILLLAEEGRLSVHDKVGKYFSALTRANDISLLDLMNHVSGYPDYYPLDFVDRRMAAPIAEDELIRQYAGAKLDFEPGSRYSYSNTGFVILGRVVEKVSGESFGKYLERRILQPLGMTHTVYEPQQLGDTYALGHTSFALGPQEIARPEGRGWLVGAGGLFSTPSDLAKWDLALMDGKLLKPDSWSLMTTPRKLSDGRVSDYGCGLGISTKSGFPVLAHSGAVSGFLAYNAMIPATRSAVVVLANYEDGAVIGKLRGTLLSLLLPKVSGIPKISGDPAIEAAKDLLSRMQNGKVDRAQLGEEFNIFLSLEKLSSAKERLKPYGKPNKVEIANTWERGGMEVVVVRFTFKAGVLEALMYRTPEGKIQQFLVTKE